jgi:hypothetical protein
VRSQSVEARPAEAVRVGELACRDVTALARRFAVALEWLDAAADIENSFWGAPEAGISRFGVRLRGDTPVHSLLHELCHIVCMTPERRARLDRDARGSVAEECAVCYLQVLLANYLPGFDSTRCLTDMDTWGYSFREGSAAAWFAGDGREARQWLLAHGLIDADARPTFRLRK